jgi:hypothetical protein
MAGTKGKSKANPAPGRKTGATDNKLGPNMAYLKDMAKNLGVTNFSKLNKTDLVHRIQIAEGYTPCYGSTSVCSQTQCLFRSSCLV